MQLTRQEALDDVAYAAIQYVAAQAAEKTAHERLKVAIKRGKNEANLTQQEIADATTVDLEEDVWSLSRQRISQIIHEE
jgi:hypothetical protein